MHERWPELPYEPWKETAATLHMWTQIVGKIRLATTPWLNHSWHVTLYVTPRGLTTSSMPYGERTFQIDFDFIEHLLRITTCDDESRTIPLRPQTTAEFHAAVLGALRDLDLEVKIGTSTIAGFRDTPSNSAAINTVPSMQLALRADNDSRGRRVRCVARPAGAP